MRTMLEQIDLDDPFELPQDHYEYVLPRVCPDRATWYPFVLEELHDPEPKWQIMAAKWLPELAPDPAAASAELTWWLPHPTPRVRWWVALHLSQLAPQTPRLAAVLADALHESWPGYWRRAWQDACGGRGLVAETLLCLGPAARVAVPVLRRALLEDTWNDFFAMHDYPALVATLAALTGEVDEAVAALGDDLPTTFPRRASATAGYMEQVRAAIEASTRARRPDDVPPDNAEPR